jgi:hypothetical protein
MLQIANAFFKLCVPPLDVFISLIDVQNHPHDALLKPTVQETTYFPAKMRSAA